MAYHFLASSDRPLTKLELDQRIEAWLRERFGVDIDFEVHDALGKLERLEVLSQDAEGRLSVPPIREALTRLDRQWDGYFQFNA